jgi:hypothetical protein
MGAIEEPTPKQSYRNFLRGLKYVGIVLVLAGLGMLAANAWHWWHRYERWYGSESAYPFRWYWWIGLLVAGIAALIYAAVNKGYWFTDVVGVGRIVDFEWTSNRFGDAYYAVVRGHNRVGEPIEGLVSISPKIYYGSEVGDKINCGH